MTTQQPAQWCAGANQPGYLPDNEPCDFETWQGATGERDWSDSNDSLNRFNGQRVHVSNPYVTMSGQELRTFVVGRTTGWRPATLLIRNSRQRGSSELVGPDYRPGAISLA